VSQATIQVESFSESESVVESAVTLTPSLHAQCIAEFVGTFIVILIGDGAVAAAVMTNQLDGWGVAMMWGLAVTFGIYVAGPVSGAHFNPAVTITMAVFRDFPRRRVVPFILSQIAGAFTGAAATGRGLSRRSARTSGRPGARS
jgi:glycerol uptake facilitator-like aquaporin